MARGIIVAITTPTTANTGRLPTTEVAWPVTDQSFAALVEQWRKGHVWLSLWNHEGRVVAFDEDAGRFWSSLWNGDSRFRADLSSLACRMAASADNKDAPDSNPFGPWMPDLAVMAAPVRHRRRIVGVVLGAAVVSHSPGEAFDRLCSQNSLDRETAARDAQQFGVLEVDEVDRTHKLLEFTVNQAKVHEVGEQEIEVLTENLESTYEELNLIYRVSGMMGLPQKPIEMLGRVVAELLDVSRAAGVACVLTEHGAMNYHACRGGVPSVPRIEERVVQVGAGAPGLDQVERMYASLSLSDSERPAHVLMNDASQRPELRWSSDWLQHLLALPLWHEKGLMGVLLAINCNDVGDFTSVDVQLFRAVADRITAFLENQRLYDDLADLLMGLLHALVNAIDAKDPYTCGHSERVAFLSRRLAQAVNLPPPQCERIYLAGLMHDVGKIGVPDAVLGKPGKLTNEEFDAMRKHPEVGARILSRVRQVRDLIPGILCHHERVDGRGYPNKLAGQDIPLLGRLICLADCFDAMTTNRTYRAALPLSAVIAEIRRCAGTQFDPQLAEVFLKLDLESLMQEARECAGGDPNIGYLGALSAGITGLSTSDDGLRSLQAARPVNGG